MKQPPKRSKDAALKAARHYLALFVDPRARPGDEALLLARLNDHAAKLTRAYNTRNPGLNCTVEMVLSALDAEARRLGPLVPLLGKEL